MRIHPGRRRHAAAARRPLATVAGLLTVAAVLAACGPAISPAGEAPAATAEVDPDVLVAPAEEAPSGEITIWDRSGDLYNVFDATIEAFNEKYPDIVVNHEAVDIDAKLQNALITGSDVPDGVFLDDAKVAGFADHLWNLS